MLRNRNRNWLRFLNRNKIESQKLTQFKNCVFDFFQFTIFSFTFYKKFDETIFPLLKSLRYHVKKARFFQIFFCESCDFYGLDTELEPEPELYPVTCQKSEPEP